MTDSDIKTPRPGPDSEVPGERHPADAMTGSQTGTIGGGGRDAHNPSPIRAPGSDDETVDSADDTPDEEFEESAFDDEDDEEADDAEDVEAE